MEVFGTVVSAGDTRKDRFMRQIQEMFDIRGEYLEEAKALDANAEFTEEGKAKRREAIFEDYSMRVSKAAEAIRRELDGFIGKIDSGRQAVVQLRGQQGYNLQMQNALRTLELAGGDLTEREILDAVEPFKGDTLTMKALHRAAILGGVDAAQADKLIAFKENPAFDVLGGLKRLVERYADCFRSGEGDFFTMEIPITLLLDKMNDDMNAKRDCL